MACISLIACGSGVSDDRSGGEATVFDTSRDAFSRAFPTLSRANERSFFRGRALFRDGWVTAPASTQTRDGLGPVFNARSCIACHARDGRGRPPEAGEDMFTMLIRLSVPGVGEDGGPVPEPTYGGQLQPQALLQIPYEGRATVTYSEEMLSSVSVRAPTYHFDDLNFGPLADDALFSPRVASSVFGLGLLEAIPEATLQSWSDPDDADGDGISGRLNRVWDTDRQGVTVGRFGWKASQPSVKQQAAAAFNGDIGITSESFPTEDCSAAQVDCQNAPSGGEPELLDTILQSVALYNRSLAVPARRDVEDGEVAEGEALFVEVGCEACHVAEATTEAIDDLELGPQTIHAYTDLLLHDMGDALADGRSDFLATGNEWRTPPLWGIGLQETVNGHLQLLHDGRARGFKEAIAWHGGEAAASRAAFFESTPRAQAALIRFLESL